MVNENMLVDNYLLKIFKFICTYEGRVYEFKKVKLISQKIHVMKISTDKIEKTGTCTCKICIRTRTRTC